MPINPDVASLDEMNLFLGECLVELRRRYNQRIPEHVAGVAECFCDPRCDENFGRAWAPAEPHIETLIEAMCQAGDWYLMALLPTDEQRKPGYRWRFYKRRVSDDSEGDREVGFDASSPLLVAYRAAVRTVLRAGMDVVP